MRGPNKQCGGSSSGMSLIVQTNIHLEVTNSIMNLLSIGEEHIVEDENVLEIQDWKMRRGSPDHL